MQAMEQDRLDNMESEAIRCSDLHQYEEAERLYREIIDTRMRSEGVHATYRDMYNLSSVLVAGRKYEEAEPVLSQLLVHLRQRESGRETSFFIQQEAGTARVLGRALEGLGKSVEAQNMLETAAELNARALNAD